MVTNLHKRGTTSYHPQLAFCTAAKNILQGWMRGGSAYTSNVIVAFMQQLALMNASHISIEADSME